ncbi:MAG: MATE family efflux transporter [Burkholderiaceae bacterium]
MSAATLSHDARRIASLAWPVFIGQVAVLAFSTVDTLMAARASALDLAALAIGSAVYVTVFIGLMGLVLAVAPIAGQLFGAGKHLEAGAQLHQAMWLALGASVLGCTLLLFPQVFLNLSQASIEVAAKVRAYLAALAWALPSALLFTAFRGFNTAVSRPKIVMLLQLGALLLKVPLTAMLVFGVTAGALEVPAQGAAGCGIATALVMACQLGAAWILLRRDPFYAPFGLHGRIAAPHRASLGALLRLGVPMGSAIAIEVTGFTFMAFFISRIGSTPVAGHQIALNLLSLMFMMPMAIGNATSTLVAQFVGAADAGQAQRLGWNGLGIGVGLAALMAGAVYALRVPILHLYTRDAAVIAAALPLLAWLVLFHVADAAQTIAAFVLRAYRIASVPLLIYVVAIWGVGLGGGYVLAFDGYGISPRALRGAPGYWSAATAGLVLAALALCAFLAWTLRRQRAAPLAPSGT